MSDDFAKAEHVHSWLHHSVIGDPSWDSFERESGNPIFTGREPMLWSVNGFLFHDPVSGKWHAYIGLYPRNYWPCGDSLVMREEKDGQWKELGLAVKGDAALFDGEDGKPGYTPDVSVVYDGGKYHMVYDWGNPSVTKSGIGYAWAERPEGPFHRASAPLHLDIEQPLMLRRYRRVYAATLIKRKEDWIILAMTDCPGAGDWAMLVMTSKRPEGPYSAPKLLLHPQSDIYHPLTMEFYPAFVHEGHVYAPATSVAKNRSYQALFKAPLEKAHLESGWTLEMRGSMWHQGDALCEAQGIWGQTFSGQVTDDGVLRVLFPCKNAEDVGTISIARREWARPYKDGFVVSAPNAEAYAVLRRSYSEFDMVIQAEARGKWALCWDCRGPLGPDRRGPDAQADKEMRKSRTELRFDGDAWSVMQIDDRKQETLLGSGSATKPQTIRVTHQEGRTEVYFDGKQAWSCEEKRETGRIEIIGETGSLIKVGSMVVDGKEEPYRELWLPMEGIAGFGSLPGEWEPVEDERFYYGQGFVSTCKEAEAKWNFFGAGFKLHLPKGPEYGVCAVSMDGEELGTVDLRSDAAVGSSVVLERSMTKGYHALKIRPAEGKIPCDVLEVV